MFRGSIFLKLNLKISISKCRKHSRAKSRQAHLNFTPLSKTTRCVGLRFLSSISTQKQVGFHSFLDQSSANRLFRHFLRNDQNELLLNLFRLQSVRRGVKVPAFYQGQTGRNWSSWKIQNWKELFAKQSDSLKN